MKITKTQAVQQRIIEEEVVTGLQIRLSISEAKELRDTLGKLVGSYGVYKQLDDILTEVR